MKPTACKKYIVKDALCRRDKVNGCSQCRVKLGLMQNEDGSWQWKEVDDTPNDEGEDKTADDEGHNP